MASSAVVHRLGLLVLLVFAVGLSTAGAAGAGGGIPTGDGSWTWLNPTPQGNDLNGVWFVSGVEGWAVGDLGTIIHTTDGGATWTRQHAPTGYDLADVQFVDAQHGWVAGYDPTDFPQGDKYTKVLLKTTDGGATWTKVSLPVGATPYHALALSFVSASEGWVVGDGVVVHTSDAGATWTFQDCPGAYSTVRFTDALHGWAGGGWEMWRTADGGGSWTPVSVHPPVNIINDMWFIDNDTGWAVGVKQGDADGYGVVLKTTDGGQHWSIVATPRDALRSVWFASATEGWACNTELGKIWHTTDGGTTWMQQAQDDLGYTGLAFGSTTEGFVVGMHGIIRRTADAGAHWTHVDTAPVHDSYARFTDVAMTPDGAGWAVGQWRRIIATKDGGDTWIPQEAVIGTKEVLCVDAVDQLHAWIGGQFGLLLRTTDGGATWDTLVAPGGPLLDVRDIAFVSSLEGWLVCRDGTWHTTDGGLTWQALMGGGNSLCALASGHLSIAEYRGVILSDDGGLTGRVVGIADMDFSDVAFGDARHGVAIGLGVGSGGHELWRTGDGGANWTKVDLAAQDPPIALTSRQFSSVEFGDATSVYVTCPAGLLHSGDGGSTWDLQELRSDPIVAADFVSWGKGWVVTETGGVIGTQNGGAADTQAPTTSAPGLAGAWRRNPLIEFLGTDDTSGIGKTEFQVDGGAWAQGSSVTLGEGTHTVTYRSTDKAGNVEAPDKSGVAMIDLTRPVTAAEGVNDAWHNASTTIHFSATDNLSGVAATHSTVNGHAAPNGSSIAITPGQDTVIQGANTVTFWSEDVAGNVEAAQSRTVKIDTVAPLTSHDYDGSYLHNERIVTLDAVDTHSGVEATFYRFDDEPTWRSGTAVPVPAPDDHSFDGDHTVWFYSEDIAGNEESVRSVVVHVDTSPTPQLTSAGQTTLNRPKASWELSGDWRAIYIEVSRSDQLTHDGYFSTPIYSAEPGENAADWEAPSSECAALPPGTTYIHLLLYNAAWQESRWTTVRTIDVPDTKNPKQYPTVVRIKAVKSSGGLNIQLRYPVKVSDDSRGPILITFRQRRYVKGVLKGESTRSWTKPGPRTYGRGAHTYVIKFDRALECRGKGVYEIMTRVQDLEYNWSNKLYLKGSVPF
jgi:photosystem II stability/assembly factor-like uncharacterized protein